MKRTLTKIPAMIGMGISLVSFGFLIAALLTPTVIYPFGAFTKAGLTPAQIRLVFSLQIATGSLIFYSVDAVLSIIKACKKIHPVFNAVLSVVLIGAFPMIQLISFGPYISLQDPFVWVWYAYYLAIFIVEIVSIVKHVRLNAKPRTVD